MYSFRFNKFMQMCLTYSFS
uniref:Uncharacterized protein n=1 Tax=Heterorhabditis bacteriophora TaxID=37862 RepID=A0A1I7WBB5_HETBA